MKTHLKSNIYVLLNPYSHWNTVNQLYFKKNFFFNFLKTRRTRYICMASSTIAITQHTYFRCLSWMNNCLLFAKPFYWRHTCLLRNRVPLTWRPRSMVWLIFQSLSLNSALCPAQLLAPRAACSGSSVTRPSGLAPQVAANLTRYLAAFPGLWAITFKFKWCGGGRGLIILLKRLTRDFPGGPVAKAPCSQCRRQSSATGQGTEDQHVLQPLKLPPNNLKKDWLDRDMIEISQEPLLRNHFPHGSSMGVGEQVSGSWKGASPSTDSVEVASPAVCDGVSPRL